MKFAEHLRECAIPEWRDKYVNYKLGKKKLKAYKESIKATAVSGGRSGGRTGSVVSASSEYHKEKQRLVDEFVMGWIVGVELKKCDEFYQWQLQSCGHKFNQLRQQIKIYCDRKMHRESRSYGATPLSSGSYEGAEEMRQEASPPPDLEKDQSLVGMQIGEKILSFLRDMELVPCMPERWRRKNKPTSSPHYAPHMETFTVENLTPRQIRVQLSNAVLEFYMTLQLLKNYRDLNVTGFRKIVKKLDKACQTKELSNFMAYANDHSPMFQHMGQNLQLYAKNLQKANSLLLPSTQLDLPQDKDPLTFWEGKVSTWYTDTLTDSAQDRKHHVQKLRNLSLQYTLNEQMVHQTNRSLMQMFFGGNGIGIAVVFIAYTLYLGISSDLGTYTHTILFPVWAGMYLTLLMALFFCLDCFIWFRSKINFQFIMFGELHSGKGSTTFNNDFSSTRISGYIFLVAVAAVFCSAFALVSFEREQLIWWVVWVALFLCTMVCPFNIIPNWYSLRQTRRSLLVTTIRLVFAGAFPVKFGDFFLGDLVCSLTYSIADFATVGCVFAGSPHLQCGSSSLKSMGILSALPSYWRLMQCVRRFLDSDDWFPHLLNAGKYSFGILYSLALCTYRISMRSESMSLVTYRTLFIVIASLNSIYTSVWDLVMDWSLFQLHSQNLFLRDDLYLAGKRDWQTGKYPKRKKSFYYICMIVDVLIRFQWIVYAITTTQIQQSAVTSFILAAVEVFRRFIWVIFRVENEHVANVHLFKITGDTPLPFPISNACAKDIENDIDEEGAYLKKKDPTLNALQEQENNEQPRLRRNSVLSMISWAHAKDFQRPPLSARSATEYDEVDDDYDD
ncbi:HCL150Cp [Eremothecium sinecaudum]|uniref:HCL150Cp n=1 Tax=Eremothecium sinecaudum TaxID=45286 RepID=A0A0X8HRA3_9SACH|nr:HCL150Cp [Eremothecium sinecaudum]AMD20001.1 HCL150Cp [Eremothecium sinecaudum]